MMPAIRVEKLSKEYRRGTRGVDEYDTLRESISSAFSAPVRRLLGRRSRSEIANTFKALDDVSFDIHSGEVVGIIGRNGAGKSTLLKILSRIVEPTSGRAEIRGRLGSLLEVGTGFHPELTGRENIYLNGSILGMKREEISRKFDEIVAFSEIEKFLDTPVKRYSSGMYVRLAFAVAAHLELEVLIVDEVLAVGDAEFQKKCLGKMEDAARQGRTVLFVSHNMPVLQTLCHRGIILQEGAVTADLPIVEAVGAYLRSVDRAATTDLTNRTDRHGNGAVRLSRIRVMEGNQAECGRVIMGRPARVVIEYGPASSNVSCVFTIADQYGYGVAKFNSSLVAPQDAVAGGLHTELTCVIDEWLLAPGQYRVNASLYIGGELQDQVEAAAVLEVERGPVQGREPPRSQHDWKCLMPHRWSNAR